MQLTRTPWAAVSRLSERVNIMIAARVAPTMVWFGAATRPESEAKVTIEPPCPMAGRAAR